MSTLHPDEINVDLDLVTSLIRENYPGISSMPISQVESGGTDNWMFRIGHKLCARLPRRPEAAPKIIKEARWLPLFQYLPLAVPKIALSMEPSRSFPWHWMIVDWIDAEQTNLPADQHKDDAKQLAQFLRALRALETDYGPLAGRQNNYRGVPLSVRTTEVQNVISSLSDQIDAKACNVIWQQALSAMPHYGPGNWVHGDVHSGNLLRQKGKIAAVLDWGLCGIGDPACDLTVAWTDLNGAGRDTFKSALQPTKDEWARGKGWALAWAVVALDYYIGRHPQIEERARRTINALVLDL